MARGKTRAQLDSDRQLNLALTRLLEIKGQVSGVRFPVPGGERGRVRND
jgi:hypothetical protein